MTASEITRKIAKQGCRLLRHGARHDIWMNPKTGGATEIPRHKAAEVPTGTANRIFKDLGLK